MTSQLYFCVLRRIQTASWWDTQQSRPQGGSSALTSTFEGDLSPLPQKTEGDLSQVPADQVPAQPQGHSPLPICSGPEGRVCLSEPHHNMRFALFVYSESSAQRPVSPAVPTLFSPSPSAAAADTAPPALLGFIIVFSCVHVCTHACTCL